MARNKGGPAGRYEERRRRAGRNYKERCRQRAPAEEEKKKVLVGLIGGGGFKREMPAFKISESLAGNNYIFSMGGLQLRGISSASSSSFALRVLIISALTWPRQVAPPLFEIQPAIYDSPPHGIPQCLDPGLDPRQSPSIVHT